MDLCIDSGGLTMGRCQSSTDSSEAEAFLSDQKETFSDGIAGNNKTPRNHRFHLFVLYATNVLLSCALIWSLAKKSQPTVQEFYSPARDILRYEDVVFLDNVYEVSKFQGPPDDTKDELWDLLYRNTSTTVIDAQAAKRLPNRTMVVPGTDGDGIISLEVFHQLHCLNSLRKSLYPERFPDYGVFFPNGTRNLDLSVHHDHCVDRIRQATMCASNLGATYWNWNSRLKRWHINMKTTQTCRNFEDVRQWAVARNLLDWDPTTPSRLTD